MKQKQKAPRELVPPKNNWGKQTLQQRFNRFFSNNKKFLNEFNRSCTQLPQMVFFSEACSWTYDSSIQGAAANELGRLRRWNNSRDPRGGGRHPGATEKKLPGGFWKRPRFFLVSKHGWGLLVMAFRSQFVSNEFKNVNAWRKRLKSLASGCWQQRESVAV